MAPPVASSNAPVLDRLSLVNETACFDGNPATACELSSTFRPAGSTTPSQTAVTFVESPEKPEFILSPNNPNSVKASFSSYILTPSDNTRFFTYTTFKAALTNESYENFRKKITGFSPEWKECAELMDQVANFIASTNVNDADPVKQQMLKDLVINLLSAPESVLLFISVNLNVLIGNTKIEEYVPENMPEFRAALASTSEKIAQKGQAIAGNPEAIKKTKWLLEQLNYTKWIEEFAGSVKHTSQTDSEAGEIRADTSAQLRSLIAYLDSGAVFYENGTVAPPVIINDLDTFKTQLESLAQRFAKKNEGKEADFYRTLRGYLSQSLGKSEFFNGSRTASTPSLRYYEFDRYLQQKVDGPATAAFRNYYKETTPKMTLALVKQFEDYTQENDPKKRAEIKKNLALPEDVIEAVDGNSRWILESHGEVKHLDSILSSLLSAITLTEQEPGKVKLVVDLGQIKQNIDTFKKEDSTHQREIDLWSSILLRSILGERYDISKTDKTASVYYEGNISEVETVFLGQANKDPILKNAQSFDLALRKSVNSSRTDVTNQINLASIVIGGLGVGAIGGALALIPEEQRLARTSLEAFGAGAIVGGLATPLLFNNENPDQVTEAALYGGLTVFVVTAASFYPLWLINAPADSNQPGTQRPNPDGTFGDGRNGGGETQAKRIQVGIAPTEGGAYGAVTIPIP